MSKIRCDEICISLLSNTRVLSGTNVVGNPKIFPFTHGQSALPQSVQYDLGPEPLRACLTSALSDGINRDHPNVGRMEAVVENLELAVG